MGQKSTKHQNETKAAPESPVGDLDALLAGGIPRLPNKDARTAGWAPTDPAETKPPKEKAIQKLTEKPWRDNGKGFNWNHATEQNLKKEIKGLDTDREYSTARILLLGAIQAGKSSFLNSVASVDKGKIAHMVPTGKGGQSKTTKLKEYRPQNLFKNVIMSDTMGVESRDGAGFNVQDILYLIQGNVPVNYEFNPSSPIDPKTTANFRENPTENDRVHCVVFVIDASVVEQENIPKTIKQKIEQLRDRINTLDVPMIILLTHIDELCDVVAKDLKNIFYSVKVCRTVNMANEIFGISKGSIFPVQNYSHEVNLELEKNILLLLALRQMMYYATDFMEMCYQASNHQEKNNVSVERPMMVTTEIQKEIVTPVESSKMFGTEIRRSRAMKIVKQTGSPKIVTKQIQKEDMTEKPKTAKEGISASAKTESDASDLHEGQKVYAFFKESVEGKRDSWRHGHVAEVLMGGQLFNIAFEDGNNRFLRRSHIKPK